MRQHLSCVGETLPAQHDHWCRRPATTVPRSHRLRTALGGALLLAVLAACLGRGLWPSSPSLSASTASAAGATPTITRWEDLIPPGWDPIQRFRKLDLSALNDADPRAAQWLQDMRATWDNAPVNPALNGQSARLAGYVVPLEAIKGDIREFLLVPYYGACIHSPPPPANQVVHVALAHPAAGLQMMDAVWVSGLLQVRRQGSVMGMSAYAVQGGTVAPYADVQGAGTNRAAPHAAQPPRVGPQTPK